MQFKKGAARKVDPHPIFKPLSYVIVWFDASYPHSLHSGYESQLKELFPTYPFRMESSFEDTVRQLNTTMANCYYVLIVSGDRKKEFLDSVAASPAIVEGYVIEPLLTETHGLDSYGAKIKLCSTFPEMLRLLSQFLVPVRLPRFVESASRGFNLGLVPDPCVMSEQTVRAIRLERKEQDNQLMYRYIYAMAATFALDYFKQQLAKNEEAHDPKYLDNPLFDVMKPYLEKPEEENRRPYLDCLIQLLELSLIFDQCENLYQPLKDWEARGYVREAVRLNEEKPKLFSKIGKLWEALEDAQGFVQDPEVVRCAGKLHKHLLHFVLAFDAAKCGQERGTAWAEYPLCCMLVTDIDLCLKLLIGSIFDFADNFAEFAEPLSRALIVSDYRIGIMKEVVERLSRKTEGTFTESPDFEAAQDAVSVNTAVLLRESGKAEKVALKLHQTKIRGFVYSSTEEFCKSSHDRFKHRIVYFVADGTFTQSEYGMLIDCCVKRSITPIMVICIPKGAGKSVGKDMFRRPWTITSYVTNSSQLAVSYMEDRELYIEKEMDLFEEYYKDFQSTLAQFGSMAKSREEEKSDTELEAGWEMSEKADPKVLEKLIGELTLGQKTVGSLHFYVYSFFQELDSPVVYWENYCGLFGVCEKYINTLDINFGKNLLKAYTMQTQPPFYKMLNDAFRGGNPEKIGKFRAFYVMLHDLVKKTVLTQYVGTVHRGTYFNEELLKKLQVGSRFVATCFTSTSKSSKVAYEFASKTKRNVLLEIELNQRAYSNVDIHKEECSIYPEEQEVLLLPFSLFAVLHCRSFVAKFGTQADICRRQVHVHYLNLCLFIKPKNWRKPQWTAQRALSTTTNMRS